MGTHVRVEFADGGYGWFPAASLVVMCRKHGAGVMCPGVKGMPQITKEEGERVAGILNGEDEPTVDAALILRAALEGIARNCQGHVSAVRAERALREAGDAT